LSSTSCGTWGHEFLSVHALSKDVWRLRKFPMQTVISARSRSPCVARKVRLIKMARMPKTTRISMIVKPRGMGFSPTRPCGAAGTSHGTGRDTPRVRARIFSGVIRPGYSLMRSSVVVMIDGGRSSHYSTTRSPLLRSSVVVMIDGAVTSDGLNTWEVLDILEPLTEMEATVV
jgi:hypothetical protein